MEFLGPPGPTALTRVFAFELGGSGTCRAFCPPWGPSVMISSGALTGPGGWAEGTADGCPASREAGILPLRPLLAHPVGQPFWAGLSGPCQSQGGRWAGSLGFGPREGLWWPGQCGRRWARQRLLFLHGVVAVPQSKGSGSLSSALSFYLDLFAHWPVRPLEPREDTLGKVWNLAGMQPGSWWVGWDLKPSLGSESSVDINLAESENLIRHSDADQKWCSRGKWTELVIFPS